MTGRASADDIDFAALIEPVARALLGEPNAALSSPKELRFGSRGSISVAIGGRKRGLWHDHEAGRGGGVIDLVAERRGVPRPTALDWLRAGGFVDAAPPVQRSAPAERNHGDTVALAQQVWRDALEPVGTRVVSYLASRALDLPPDAPLRFHPSCPRGRDERLPAMIALMTDPATAEPCGVHRTFLRPDGSGKIEHGKPKMMLGNAGIVRLVPDAEVTMGLGVAEGIETSLATMQTAGWSPVWACGSAGAIAKFPALAGIESLTIFADLDDKGAGLSAARTCADRWREAGRATTIVKPPHGRDWLDALTEKGAAA